MNRLVNALLEHPQVVDQAVQEEEVAPFDLLLDTLGDALLSERERELIAEDGPLRAMLGASYLPTITAPDWEGALGLAEDDTEVRWGWWTVMFPATIGGVGLTIPQDSSDNSLVAMFTGPSDAARVLVYDPAFGSLVDLPPDVHCGPPSRGECAPGTCGGCRPRRVWDSATGLGIKCRCPDRVS